MKRLYLLAALAALIPASALAGANSAFDIGLNYYGSDVGKSLTGSTGYFMHFQVKSGGKWINPTFGASLEFNSGKASLPAGSLQSTLIAGDIEGGVEVVPQTEYVNPFIAAHGVLGWASLGVDATQTRSISLTYGFEISGGTEIRISNKEEARGIRIRTAFRFLTTNMAGVNGFQLNALQIGIGMVF
ncbi:MAG TPA: hypothetical protein VL588_12910 [Bdellovibrionota bacterium]|nr:hypothetical protein [Bdellovibrionota bacterium]